MPASILGGRNGGRIDPFTHRQGCPRLDKLEKYFANVAANNVPKVSSKTETRKERW